ncbi:MAG: ABC transporter substrate-binding protein [Thermodesulfobacteriota bacterium]
MSARRVRPILAVLLLALALVWPADAPAASDWDQAVLKVGVLEEPKSLNPWLAGDAWSSHVQNLLYQPLFLRNPADLKPVPWLAAEPAVFDAATLSYTVRLRPARWSDGSPLDAGDVVFTAEVIKKLQVPRFASLWAALKNVEALAPDTVRFTLARPDASFASRALGVPILARSQWEPIVHQCMQTKRPLASLLQARVDQPLSSGPFAFAEWRKGVYVYLKRNPHFFGQGLTIAGRELGPRIEGVVFKVYGTSDAAILGLRKGSIDYYWNNIQPGYLRQLTADPAIKLYTSQKSALYFLGFNLRRQPTADPAFRAATAMLIDKHFIIKRVLQGAGEVMSSILPAGNRLYHLDETPEYDQSRDRRERLALAVEMLAQAGYTWERRPETGGPRIIPGRGIRTPDGNQVKELAILTPPADYDPQRAMVGVMVQEWLGEAGVPAFARPMAFGAMLDRVKNQHDFDLFVLGYGNLPLDPGWLGAFFISANDKPRGWNMSGYRNAEFDRAAEAAARAMDPELRRPLVLDMQRMLMRDAPFLPLYNPTLVEAARSDRFGGWVPMVGGIGNIWTFCELRPAKMVAQAPAE